jgi:hypothetical protein
MERVLIVAKTHMGDGYCVSGLMRSANRHIRLVPPGHYCQPADTEFAVGQAWDIEFQPVPRQKPPHVENVVVTQQCYVNDVKNLRDILVSRVQPWVGGPEALYDGLLTVSNRCYVPRSGPIPPCSTGYWLPDKPLLLARDSRGKLFYEYYIRRAKRMSECAIKFVGLANAIELIPAQTLVRVSLARWFCASTDTEEKCYLQISGWYL